MDNTFILVEYSHFDIFDTLGTMSVQEDLKYPVITLRYLEEVLCHVANWLVLLRFPPSSLVKSIKCVPVHRAIFLLIDAVLGVSMLIKVCWHLSLHLHAIVASHKNRP